MMKRLPLLLLAVAASSFLCPLVSRAETLKPNIVYIISDDQAWTDYGFMGHKLIETPNLDRLAARSAVFPRGYVPTALCRPALATLANGLYAHQHGVTGNDPAMEKEIGKKEKGKPEGKPEGKPKGKPKGETPEYAALREKLIAKMDVQPTIADLLSGAGYLSHQSGKW